jgi:hypothetical protein
MDSKKYHHWLLLFLCPFFIHFSCNKNETKPCRQVQYVFTVESNCLPSDSTYSIGDTLIVQSSFSKNLLDVEGSLVNYSNSTGVGGNIFINELDSVREEVKNAVGSFSIFSINGSHTLSNAGNANFINTLYLESIDSFKLKIGFIPQKKGLFAFFLSDLGSTGIRGKNCTNASFVNTISNTNRHINYFEFAIDYTPRLYENQRYFCFRVL